MRKPILQETRINIKKFLLVKSIKVIDKNLQTLNHEMKRVNLEESTKRERRNLIIWSFITLIFVFGGANPSEFQVFGISFNEGENVPHLFKIIGLIVITYLFLQYVVSLWHEGVFEDAKISGQFYKAYNAAKRASNILNLLRNENVNQTISKQLTINHIGKNEDKYVSLENIQIIKRFLSHKIEFIYMSKNETETGKIRRTNAYFKHKHTLNSIRRKARSAYYSAIFKDVILNVLFPISMALIAFIFLYSAKL